MFRNVTASSYFLIKITNQEGWRLNVSFYIDANKKYCNTSIFIFIYQTVAQDGT